MKRTMTLIVDTEHGLHARVAAELTQAVRAFQADIVLSGNGASADAKSVIGLLLLGATKGTELTVTANGIDAADALLAIRQTHGLSALEPHIWGDLGPSGIASLPP